MTYASQPGKHARARPVCKALIARSLRDSFQSDDLTEENDNHDDALPKKEPPLPAAQVITGRRQTEWTGATRCPRDWTLNVMMEKA
jgi:hypothetical protein